MTGQKSQFNVLVQLSVVHVLESGFLRMCICAALYIEDHHCMCEMYGPTCTYVNMTMLLTCMCIFICKQVNYFELLIT